MRALKGISALCLAMALTAVGCSSEGSADFFTLANGITLPIHEEAKLQTGCIVLSTRLPPNEDRVCLEFPMEPVRAGLDPLEWYRGILVQKGFEWSSGAANQHRFNWPTEYGCFLRLNASAIPKDYIQGEDWSGMKTYVAVFEFEDDERCE